MKQEYSDWIANWLLKNNPYGKCLEAVSEMQKVFPELKRIRGHYYCLAWGEREHWWLEDENGGLVDPTCSQFPTKGSGPYVPWDESQPEPTGRCPNCGELCYNGNYCCSENCEIEYRAYCSHPY